jgi:hypothetical protein
MTIYLKFTNIMRRIQIWSTWFHLLSPIHNLVVAGTRNYAGWQWGQILSPLSCILPGLYSNSKNECVSLYFDSKYPNNVNYKNVLPEGIKGYVYKIY